MAKAAEGGRRGRGFERTSGLLAERIRKAGESRGFAVARLLTHWTEIVGEETARMARPVKVSYGRDGFGATLTVLAPGSVAPLLQMKLPEIAERVNACYGYRAISRVRITQTAPEGFAEPRAAFEASPAATLAPEVEARIAGAADEIAGEVRDPRLRSVLEVLGRNVLSKS